MQSIAKTKDLTVGKILPKMLVFLLPLIATSVLQLLFNTADFLVVGRWGGETESEREIALASVGSCGALYNMMISLFIGISVGAGVIVARSIGAKEYKDASDGVHTAMMFSFICGFAVGAAGYILTPRILSLMINEKNNSPEVLAGAVKYLRAVMCGIPANLVYNYSASLLRSDGETRKPLFFLSFSGAVNVGLNLLFVLVFRLGALGVGIATAISQWLSALLLILYMLRDGGNCHLVIKKLKIDKSKLSSMVKIGLPSGLQGMLFSFSNVLIQSSINRFGDAAMAGNSAACDINAYVDAVTFAVRYAIIAFIGQNLGAKNIKRVKESILYSVLIVSALGLVVGVLTYLFGEPLVSLFVPGNEVAIEFGKIRIFYVVLPYFLCGLMDVGAGCLIGYGKATQAMIFSLTGAVIFRVIWLSTVCIKYEYIDLVYLSYPITWIMTLSLSYSYLIIMFRKQKRQNLS